GAEHVAPRLLVNVGGRGQHPVQIEQHRPESGGVRHSGLVGSHAAASSSYRGRRTVVESCATSVHQPSGWRGRAGPYATTRQISRRNVIAHAKTPPARPREAGGTGAFGGRPGQTGD